MQKSLENQTRKVYKPICLCHSAPCSNNMTRLVNKQGPLTADQLRAIVKKYDANNDGGLNKEELKDAFQSLGARLPGWTARRALHHADANGDGVIGVEELGALLQYASKHGYNI
ncbi:hypothetical protein I3842_16G044000 [Carya illinoinensis]|uniref:EF-hand domain-containing protein n=1 Tax=Carya illinoinensis TaxID=32201 RepID=A0A922D4D9_CARIL|nr:hypothetical protein I3842_16G044000 [Carya illinoinensis]